MNTKQRNIRNRLSTHKVRCQQANIIECNRPIERTHLNRQSHLNKLLFCVRPKTHKKKNKKNSKAFVGWTLYFQIRMLLGQNSRVPRCMFWRDDIGSLCVFCCAVPFVSGVRHCSRCCWPVWWFRCGFPLALNRVLDLNPFWKLTLVVLSEIVVAWCYLTVVWESPGRIIAVPTNWIQHRRDINQQENFHFISVNAIGKSRFIVKRFWCDSYAPFFSFVSFVLWMNSCLCV